MTATMTQVLESLATYGPTAWTNPRGTVLASVRNGHRLVTIAPIPAGVRVAKWIDYGDDAARSFCDSRNYKSASAAARFAREHLR